MGSERNLGNMIKLLEKGQGIKKIPDTEGKYENIDDESENDSESEDDESSESKLLEKGQEIKKIPDTEGKYENIGRDGDESSESILISVANLHLRKEANLYL